MAYGHKFCVDCVRSEEHFWAVITEQNPLNDWEQYQPEVTIVIMRDYIQIKFIKKEADALNIYKRSGKNAEWLFTATVTNSPFDDFDVELEGEMEYCFRGVTDKSEIGIPVIIFIDDLKFQVE